MITVSNSLSFLRIPLAFLFLFESPYTRFAAVLLAMFTDSIDGYLARRSQSVSRFGAILDPATDKFFVYFALTTLFLEGRLLIWHILAMLSRDVVVSMYGFFMLVMGRWKSIVFRSVRAGKVTTALQFMVLMGLVFQMTFSWITYSAFVVMGGFMFVELFQAPDRIISPWKNFDK
jgi:CDP-diacylglycerol--glycerol-3-phosphate 3-phosphatidyltransferase